MNNVESSENKHELSSQQYAEAVLRRSQSALREAVAVVAPETPGADPLTVFPAPNEVRADDAGLRLTEPQESDLRRAAAELGFGRESDRNLSELGLQGAHVIIEGGQPHKVVAEAELVLEDETAQPASWIFSGSPHRRITNPAEQASAERLGVMGETEYDVVRNVAQRLPGFVAEEHEVVLGRGYDILNNYAPTDEQSGQFIRIGAIGDAPVVLLRIDRENYEEEGQPKYRYQPGTADVMKIVETAVVADGDTASPIAFVTSATYQPSREVDAVAVGLNTNRVVGVATYGTQRLAAVKGEAVPAPGPINQLPGELHKLAQQVQKLQEIVQAV